MSGLQPIISVSNYTQKGLGPRVTIYQTTSGETSAWSIITKLSNSRFKEEGWCGLSPVSGVVCDQLFPHWNYSGFKVQKLMEKWGGQGCPSQPASDCHVYGNIKFYVFISVATRDGTLKIIAAEHSSFLVHERLCPFLVDQISKAVSLVAFWWQFSPVLTRRATTNTIETLYWTKY